MKSNLAIKFNAKRCQAIGCTTDSLDDSLYCMNHSVFTHPGYIQPNREWYISGSCACDNCRFHPPRKCPMEGVEGVKAQTLWTSRER